MYLNSNTNMEPPLFRNTAILGVQVNYIMKQLLIQVLCSNVYNGTTV